MQQLIRISSWPQRYLLLASVAVVCVMLLGSLQRVYAHGTPSFPVSRAYACYLEGPENPSNAACQAAKALGGSQPFYDWNAISQNSYGAIGEDNGYIFDGHLCSANNEHYKGLDLARGDWPATTLPSGATVTFVYKATAPHAGTIRFYSTNDTYDPSKPLAWSNVDLTPFATYQAPAQADSQGNYVIPNVQLPANKHGRQIIYSVWQRDDPAGETFYGCSDVDFEDSATS